MLSVPLLVVVVVVVLVVFRRRRVSRRLRALENQLRTNISSLPILGHTYKFLGTHEDQMETIKEIGRDALEMGGISKFMYFNQLMLSVADPTVAEIILRENLDKHELIADTLSLLMQNSSFFSPVQIWRPRRKVNASIFNSKHLFQFGEVMSRNAKIMSDLLEQEVNKGTFSIWKYTTNYSFNSVCENILGVQVNNCDGDKFQTALEELLEMASYAVCRPWLSNKLVMRFDPLYKLYCINKAATESFLTKVIQEKRISLENKRGQICCGDVLPSFLGQQLESTEHSKFSDEELYEECLTLLVAGYDTSATAIAFTLLMLSRHPEVQEKVHAELQEVLGDSDRPIRNNDLPEMKYLESVIKETLRLYPIGPLIIRKLDKDIVLSSGLTLVQGCGAMINIWMINRHPGYWGADADLFRPERFLDSTTTTRQTAYMPFSYGPRGCIDKIQKRTMRLFLRADLNDVKYAQQMVLRRLSTRYRYAMLSLKLAISSVVRRYKLVAPPGVALAEPLRTKFNLLNKHCDDYQIQIQRRP